jgi:prolipoprotein diacylglyceryltransferase
MLQVLWHIPIKTAWTPDGIPLYGFGLMLFLAFLLCTWLGGRLAERVGISRETIQDLAIWLFIGGLLGARLTFLLSERRPASVGEFFALLPRIWDGGIVLYGAVVGGTAAYFLAYYLVFRKYNLSTLKLADVIAPCMAVGLCLGRLGCFLNGCCYGQVACADCPVYAAHFPLSAAPLRGNGSLVDRGYQALAGFTPDPSPVEGQGVKVALIDPGSAAYAAGLRKGDVIVAARAGKGADLDDPGAQVRGPGDLATTLAGNWPRGENNLTLRWRPRDGGDPVTKTIRPLSLGLYPTQVYEVVSMFLMFLVLMAYWPLRHHDGQLMAVLMVGYGIHRALNEMLRDDPRPEGLEQYTSILLVVLGVLFWAWLWRRGAAEATVKSGSATTIASSAPAPGQPPEDRVQRPGASRSAPRSASGGTPCRRRAGRGPPAPASAPPAAPAATPPGPPGPRKRTREGSY